MTDREAVYEFISRTEPINRRQVVLHFEGPGLNEHLGVTGAPTIEQTTTSAHIDALMEAGRVEATLNWNLVTA